MATIDVYVVDDSSFDLTMWIDSALTWGDTGVQSVVDMVAKVNRLCSNGDRIATLTIVGHGNEEGQYIGREWVTQKSLSTHRPSLAQLARLFSRPGQVVMGGCRQGRNGAFLLALSDILNVPVVGYTALQRPGVPGPEGGSTVCYITCTRSGRTSADSFDEVQLSVMDWFRRLAN